MLADLGTENTIVGLVYCLLRSRGTDSRANERAFKQVTRSKINQKIGCFWSFLYRSLIADIRRDLLNALSSDWYDIDDREECQIAQLIACPLLQRELDKYAVLWNECKRIRNQKNNVLPNDEPDLIFNFPELYGLENYNCAIDQDLISIAKRYVVEQSMD